MRLGRAYKHGRDIIIFDKWRGTGIFLRIYGGKDEMLPGGDAEMLRDETVRRWNLCEDAEVTE